MSKFKRISSKKDIYGDIRKHGEEIYRSKNFLSSDNNLQHGDVSVKKHSEKVAYSSLWLSRKLRIKVNEREMVRGALLHDYFLYDWHDDDHRGLHNLHGFKHPGVALANASSEYQLTAREKDIIKKHMWPLTVVPPLCRESWLVTICDKYISTGESIHFIKTTKKYYEKKKMQKKFE